MLGYFVLFILYLLAPKVDIPFYFTIRPEDLINLIAAVGFFGFHRQMPLRAPLVVKLYLAFIGVSFLSALINVGSIGLTGFVYSIRLLQYLSWYFILFEVCHRVSWTTFRRGFLMVGTIFIGWGALEFIGILGPIGKFAGASERLTINTSGPFETSVMLAMLAYSVGTLFMAGPLLIMVFLTQSRVTLVGMVFSYFSTRPLKAILAGLAVILAYSTIAQPFLQSMSDTRIGQSESPQRMLNAFVVSWERAPTLDNPIFFRERLLEGPTIYRYMVDKEGDLSFRFRAIRWPTLIKTTLHDPLAAVIGWSPGAWGNALDNYFVRIFGETGFLGLFTFLIWLAVSIRRSHPRGLMRYSLVMMTVVALFIDIFTSSKCMPLLWAFIALEGAGHPFALPQKLVQGKRLTRPELPL